MPHIDTSHPDAAANGSQLGQFGNGASLSMALAAAVALLCYLAVIFRLDG